MNSIPAGYTSGENRGYSSYTTEGYTTEDAYTTDEDLSPRRRQGEQPAPGTGFTYYAAFLNRNRRTDKDSKI